jgi:hypothetical protein
MVSRRNLSGESRFSQVLISPEMLPQNSSSHSKASGVGGG